MYAELDIQFLVARSDTHARTHEQICCVEVGSTVSLLYIYTASRNPIHTKKSVIQLHFLMTYSTGTNIILHTIVATSNSSSQASVVTLPEDIQPVDRMESVPDDYQSVC
jgi:hypothetical protein